MRSIKSIKSLTDVSGGKREKTQSIDVWHKRGDVTADSNTLKNSSKYYELLCTNKFETLDEMGKFTEKQTPPDLGLEEIDNRIILLKHFNF